MKRDMDYIRQLLLEIEAAPAAEPWSNRSSEKVGGTASIQIIAELATSIAKGLMRLT